MSFPFPLFCPSGFIETVVYSITLDADVGNEATNTRRNLATVTGGGVQIRVRFAASSVAAFNVDNCSVGIRTGAAVDTTAIPVELLFSGASGFSLSAGATIFSDWTPFVFSTSNVLVITCDNGAANASARMLSTGGEGSHAKAAANSYNLASVSGFTPQAGLTVGFNRIEARN